VKKRAVRLVQGARKNSPSLWAVVESIAPKIGCAGATRREWVKRHEIDRGVRDGMTTVERERIEALACEVKELRRANEMLRLASAFLSKLRLRLFSRRRRSTASRRSGLFHRPAP